MTAPAAVVALHYQNDVLHAQGRIRLGMGGDGQARADLLAGATALLAGARRRGLPIAHVRIAFRPDYADLMANGPIFRNVRAAKAVIDGEWGSEFFEGLGPVPDDVREVVIRHRRISAFHGTPLDEFLRAHAIRRLVLAGVATHSVVEGTVRQAVDMGYEAMVAAPACAAADPAAHAASLASMALLAGIGTVEQALDWAAPPPEHDR